MSFGKRPTPPTDNEPRPAPDLQLVPDQLSAAPPPAAAAQPPVEPAWDTMPATQPRINEADRKFAEAKEEVYGNLIESVDLVELSRLTT